MGWQLRKRHRDNESSSLEGNKWYVQDLEIKNVHRVQKEILCRNSWVHPVIRCEAWTLTKSMEKALDGTYTRMLRKALGVHWSDRVTNEILYGKLPKLSDKIAARRLRLAGHCQRHPELGAHRLILWEPTHGQRGRGRPKMTYVDQLKSDTGATTTGELAAMMNDRNVWRRTVDSRLRLIR